MVRRRRAGQALVEFSLLLIVLIPFLLLVSGVMVSLYQASAVNTGASWLGQRIADTGTACSDVTRPTSCDWFSDFKVEMAKLGVTVTSGDAISISITSTDGTVRYFDSDHPSDVPTTSYGDTVTVRFVKPITAGLFTGSGFQSILEDLPGSSTTWIGVAQLDKGPPTGSVTVTAAAGLDYSANVEADAPSAHWRLSEINGSTFRDAGGDASKAGSVGPSVGVGLPSLITAGSDGSFHLDGSTGSYLSVPDVASLRASANAAFSVEAWVSRDRAELFGGSCAASEEPLLVRGSTSIVFSRADGCAADSGALNAVTVQLGSGLRFSSSATIGRSQTHQIVLTYDGTHLASGYLEVHLYVDGTESALRSGPSDTAPIDPIYPSHFAPATVSGWTGFTGPILWGANSTSAGERLSAELDELSLYARPLAPDAVGLHWVAGSKSGNVSVEVGRTVYFTDMTNGSPSSWDWSFDDGIISHAANPAVFWDTSGSKVVSLTASTMAGSVSASWPDMVEVRPRLNTAAFGFSYPALLNGYSPVTYWRMGDASGPVMTDLTGHDSGTYTGCSSATGLLPSDSDQALGATSGCTATAPDAAALDTGSFSVSALVQRSRTGAAEEIWSRTGVSLGIDSGNRLVLSFPDGSTARSTVVLASGDLYNIAATYSGARAHLYVDGADVTSIAGTIPASLTLAGPTAIGATFSGTIDEVAFFDRDISIAQAQSLTDLVGGDPLRVAVGAAVPFVDRSSGSPVYLWWDFGDGTGSSDANPVHNYSAGGTYTVRLTVEWGNGWDATVSVGAVVAH